MRHHAMKALAGAAVVALLCAASASASFRPINKTALAAKVNATKNALMAEVGVKLNGVTVNESAPHITGAVSCYIDTDSGNVIGLQVGPRGKVLCSNAGMRRTFVVPANGYIANIKMAVDKDNGLIGELAFTIKSDDAVSLVTCGTAGGAPLSVTPPLSAVAAFSAGCKLIPASARPPRNGPRTSPTNGGAGRRRLQAEAERAEVEAADQANAVAAPFDGAASGRRRRRLLAGTPKTSRAIDAASFQILVTTINSPGVAGGVPSTPSGPQYAFISDVLSPPLPSAVAGSIYQCPLDTLDASSDACRQVSGFGGINGIATYPGSPYLYSFVNEEIGGSSVKWGTLWICPTQPLGLPDSPSGCVSVTGFAYGGNNVFSTPTATYLLNSAGSPWICPPGVFTSPSECTLTTLSALNSMLYIAVVDNYCNLALTSCTDYSSMPVYQTSPTYGMTPGTTPSTIVISLFKKLMTCPVPLPLPNNVPAACSVVDVPFSSGSMSVDPATSTIYALEINAGTMWTCPPGLVCTQSIGAFTGNIVGVALN